MTQRSPVGVAHRVGRVDGGQVRRLDQRVAVLGEVPLQGPQVLFPYRRLEAGKLLLQRRQPVDELGVKSVNPRLVHLARGSLLQQIDDLVLHGGDLFIEIASELDFVGVLNLLRAGDPVVFLQLQKRHQIQAAREQRRDHHGQYQGQAVRGQQVAKTLHFWP